MTEPIYRSDIEVSIRKHVGTDLDIVESAWVSSGVDEDEVDEKRIRGVIRSLMRHKHGSPFEEGFLSVRIMAPRAVRDEHVRHRVGSYSSSSLRYAHLDRIFYIPPPERPFVPVPGSKKMQPKYIPLDPEQYDRYVQTLKNGYAMTNWHLNSLDRNYSLPSGNRSMIDPSSPPG